MAALKGSISLLATGDAELRIYDSHGGYVERRVFSAEPTFPSSAVWSAQLWCIENCVRVEQRLLTGSAGAAG